MTPSINDMCEEKIQLSSTDKVYHIKWKEMDIYSLCVGQLTKTFKTSVSKESYSYLLTS